MIKASTLLWGWDAERNRGKRGIGVRGGRGWCDVVWQVGRVRMTSFISSGFWRSVSAAAMIALFFSVFLMLFSSRGPFQFSIRIFVAVPRCPASAFLRNFQNCAACYRSRFPANSWSCIVSWKRCLILLTQNEQFNCTNAAAQHRLYLHNFSFFAYCHLRHNALGKGTRIMNMVMALARCFLNPFRSFRAIRTFVGSLKLYYNLFVVWFATLL